MKQFNQVINVTVSVDTIAQHLLSTMQDNFKHKELVVETIVGRMLTSDSGALSLLYNALNGYSQGINFKAGDVVALQGVECYCDYQEKDGSWKTGYQPVLQGVIEEVNIHAEKKIKISFAVTGKDGHSTDKEEWIHHTQCSYLNVAVSSPEEYA